MGRYSEYVKTKKLKETRKLMGLGIKEMAKLMDFRSEVSYYNIENGIVEPRITQIKKISKILRKPCENFFTL